MQDVVLIVHRDVQKVGDDDSEKFAYCYTEEPNGSPYPSL